MKADARAIIGARGGVSYYLRGGRERRKSVVRVRHNERELSFLAFASVPLQFGRLLVSSDVTQSYLHSSITIVYYLLPSINQHGTLWQGFHASTSCAHGFEAATAGHLLPSGRTGATPVIQIHFMADDRP